MNEYETSTTATLSPPPVIRGRVRVGADQSNGQISTPSPALPRITGGGRRGRLGGNTLEILYTTKEQS
jgi:hypothetical protein